MDRIERALEAERRNRIAVLKRMIPAAFSSRQRSAIRDAIAYARKRAKAKPEKG
jgi:hypothetical protein